MKCPQQSHDESSRGWPLVTQRHMAMLEMCGFSYWVLVTGSDNQWGSADKNEWRPMHHCGLDFVFDRRRIGFAVVNDQFSAVSPHSVLI